MYNAQISGEIRGGVMAAPSQRNYSPEALMPQITQERLKELLHYDPDTGVFTWIKKPSLRCHDLVGKAAGTLRGGYIYIGIDKTGCYAHRLAWLYMTGKMPDDQIDHKNHEKDDNRWINLRAATYKLNSRNTPLKSNNTSGFVGVSWKKESNAWKAEIKVDGKSIHLGCFREKQNAINARKEANIKYGFHANHGGA